MEFCCSMHMVNLNYYEINRNQRECKFFWDELFRNTGAAGFRSIELPYDPYWQFGGRNGIPFNTYCIENSYGSLQAFQLFLAECGIDRISNLYFDPRFLESSDLNAYFGAYSHFIHQAIEQAARMAITDVVVSVSEEIGHLKANPAAGDPDTFINHYRQMTINVLKQAADFARQNQVILSVRNDYWGMGRGYEIDLYLEQVPDLKHAPDLAHLHIAGVHIDQFLKQHINRISLVTLSDTNYTDTDACYAQPSPEYPAAGSSQLVYSDLGYGQINLAKHVQTLKDLGFNGNLVCECRQTQDYHRALLRMKRVADQLKEM